MATDNKHFKYERFAKDVANHQMTVLMDNGIYRHLMFEQPDRNEHWFEIVTTPGMLVIRGDMETWAFSRIPDMFNFFRSKDGFINADYWQEKLLAGRSDSESFDSDYFKQAVIHSMEGYGFDDELKHSIIEEFLDYVDWDQDEISVRRQLMDYHHTEEGYVFQDCWEISGKVFGYHYLWCCHAIVWAINRYDAWKEAQGGSENVHH
jgi:hypothetical protein